MGNIDLYKKTGFCCGLQSTWILLWFLILVKKWTWKCRWTRRYILFILSLSYFGDKKLSQTTICWRLRCLSWYYVIKVKIVFLKTDLGKNLLRNIGIMLQVTCKLHLGYSCGFGKKKSTQTLIFKEKHFSKFVLQYVRIRQTKV